MPDPRIGKQIEDFDDLLVAARNRRSVCHKPVQWWDLKTTPAAFMIGMQARDVHNRIKRGLYIYEKPKRQEWFKKKVKV